MGQRAVLKAEIKKETTISLTMKKSNSNYDVMFKGPTDQAKAYNNSGKHGQWVDGTDDYDLAQSESGITVAMTDAFGVEISKNIDQIDPVGATDTVDMGTGESNVA